MSAKLRIGRIPFANLFPLYRMLERTADLSYCEFVEGVPSALNTLIRDGEIDISPSSSIEYLRHEDLYAYLENHSISSRGPVRSILLFSPVPLELLDGRTIITTSQSETSVVLLAVILRRFFRLNCSLVSSPAPLREALDRGGAFLLIGDEALTESGRRPGLIEYDLGDLWFRRTALPFTFALWIARRDCCPEKRELLLRFVRDLDYAKTAALASLDELALEPSISCRFARGKILPFWEGMVYDFGEEEKKGLSRFREYASDLGLLRSS